MTDPVTREELLAALAEGKVTVWTKGENVIGYMDEPLEVDLSVYICEVCGRPMPEHAVRRPGAPRSLPGRAVEGWRCPPEDAPAS